MCLNGQFSLELTIAKYLDEVFGRHIAGCVEFFYANLLQILRFCDCLQHREIDSLVFYTIDVLEAELGQTTLQRHLATFKTNLLAITGTLLGTLVTAR